MRDLLSKLDRILLEETTLQDLKKEPMARDPVIAKAIKDKEREENVDEGSDQELYGLRVGDTVRVELKGREEQGDIIDIYPDTMEVELLLKGPEAGRTITVDVRDVEYFEDVFQVGDEFGISVLEDFEIGAEIVDILEDGIVVELDDVALEYLSKQGFTFEEGELVEDKKKGLDGKACWKGYRYAGTKMKGGRRVDDCVKVKESGLQYYTGKKKYGKEGMAALAAAGRKGASEEELGRIKDRYKKEDADIDEGVAVSTMDPNAAQRLLSVYKSVSQGVEQYEDDEGADRIYDALNDVAREYDIVPHFKSLLSGASNSARMDFDTDPGHFKNWFPYVGQHLESLVKSFKESGKLEDEPDFEVEKEDLELEAKYQGREVPLGKPMAGDVKKSKVYVKNPQGNVVKVNFGDKKMKIKKSNPKRRKSFRARHNCANPGPRHKARYWSCRAW